MRKKFVVLFIYVWPSPYLPALGDLSTASLPWASLHAEGEAQGHFLKSYWRIWIRYRLFTDKEGIVADLGSKKGHPEPQGEEERRAYSLPAGLEQSQEIWLRPERKQQGPGS